jgi:hypothetical protein
VHLPNGIQTMVNVRGVSGVNSQLKSGSLKSPRKISLSRDVHTPVVTEIMLFKDYLK